MSNKSSAPAADAQADLVLANTVSRLGCSVSEARAHIAKQTADAVALTPAKPAQPTSKSGTADSGEALL